MTLISDEIQLHWNMYHISIRTCVFLIDINDAYRFSIVIINIEPSVGYMT